MQINPTAASAGVTPAVDPATSGKPAAETEKAGAPAGEKPAEPESGKTAGPATDFQTFLTLLTTQLRNQDPLKPMESTEFVAQLASFSGVEQQVRANERLDRIVEVLSGGTADGLAAWIGREVRAPTAARFEGAPLDVEVTPHSGAESAVLVVRNDFDQVVARQSVEPGTELVRWDGTGPLGETLPNGAYRFTLESHAGGALLDSSEGRVFSRVSEVRLVDGAPMLMLEGGGKVAVGEISAVR